MRNHLKPFSFAAMHEHERPLVVAMMATTCTIMVIAGVIGIKVLSTTPVPLEATVLALR